MKFKDKDLFGVLNLIQKAKGFFSGRSRLQKMIVIGKKDEDIGYDFSFHYKPYHYGPYSSDLQQLLLNLVGCGMIEEQKVKHPDYQEYKYRLTEMGQRFLKHLSTRVDNESKSKINRLWEKYKHNTRTRLVEKSKELFGYFVE